MMGFLKEVGSVQKREGLAIIFPSVGGRNPAPVEVGRISHCS